MELDHVSLPVSDLESSVRFYEQVVGLVVLRTSGDPATGTWMGTASGHDLFHLNKGDVPVASLPKKHHVALRVSDFATFVDNLNKHGVAFGDWHGNHLQIGRHPLGWFRQIYIQDPDGHWIEINDVPGTRP